MNRLLSGRVTRRRSFVILACVILIGSGLALAHADDSPVRVAAPAPPSSASPPIVSPALPDGWLPLSPIGQLFARALAPVGLDDKGTIYTDASGSGFAPAELNALEQSKLEMARRAVEASRAAGTLWVIPLGGGSRTPDPSGAAKKLELLLGAPSRPLQPDPSAAVGPLAPAQIPGTPALTPAERVKLEQSGGSSSSDGGKEGLQP